MSFAVRRRVMAASQHLAPSPLAWGETGERGTVPYPAFISHIRPLCAQVLEILVTDLDAFESRQRAGVLLHKVVLHAALGRRLKNPLPINTAATHLSEGI